MKDQKMSSLNMERILKIYVVVGHPRLLRCLIEHFSIGCRGIYKNTWIFRQRLWKVYIILRIEIYWKIHDSRKKKLIYSKITW